MDLDLYLDLQQTKKPDLDAQLMPADLVQLDPCDVDLKVDYIEM